MSAKPYFEEDGITIYHGDCREILPMLPALDAIITDPVWPNATADIQGKGRAKELLSECLDAVGACRRVGEAVYSRSEAIIEAQQLLQETRDREAATEARARGQQPQGEEE